MPKKMSNKEWREKMTKAFASFCKADNNYQKNKTPENWLKLNRAKKRMEKLRKVT